MTILAIGAAGKYAGLVVPVLAKRGVHVRGLIRKPGYADQVKRSGAAEVALGDLRDPQSLDAAFKRVHAVFYIARRSSLPKARWERPRFGGGE